MYSIKKAENKTKEINDNWEENRCKPTLIPFVSLIRTFKEGNVKGYLTQKELSKALTKEHMANAVKSS